MQEGGPIFKYLSSISATDRPWLSFVGLVTPKSKQHLDHTKQCAAHVANGHTSNYIKFGYKHKPGISFNYFDALLSTIFCTFLGGFSRKFQGLCMCPWFPMTSFKIFVIKRIGMSMAFAACLNCFTRVQAVRTTMESIKLAKFLKEALCRNIKCAKQ